MYTCIQYAINYCWCIRNGKVYGKSYWWCYTHLHKHLLRTVHLYIYIYLFLYCLQKRSWDSLLEECKTHDQKVVSLNPSRRSRKIVFSRVNFMCCWLLISICFIPLLPQWHIKDAGHSTKCADGRLHLNRHTSLTQSEWADYAAVQA